MGAAQGKRGFIIGTHVRPNMYVLCGAKTAEFDLDLDIKNLQFVY